MTIAECADYLRRSDNYLIISHRRPDGDTLGSGAALCSALRRSGKTAFCLPNPETTDNYIPLVSLYDAPEGFAPGVAVAVDIADTALLPDAAPERVELCIDHHPSNTFYAGETCVDAKKASCGEIILELIKELCGCVTKEEANLLYTAVSTDTGCFVYANTVASTFRAAAELLDLGADSIRLNHLLFRSKTRSRLTLEGMMLFGIRYYRKGSITVSIITLDMLRQSGATENDCEDLAGVAGRAEGSMLSVTIRQLAEKKCKVSLRSGPQVNCSDICSVYGGGGHAMAAGCTLELGPEDTLAAMLRAIDEKWPE